jgi:hypothetical protein
MTERRVYLLIGVALAVIAAALWLSSQRHLPRDVDVGVKMFPQLKTADIKAIEITRAGGKRSVTLEIGNNEWSIKERAGYPADASRVRALVLALAGLTTVEEKTSDVKNYPSIGVEDISAPTASGTQIEFRGVTPPVSLIVGRSSGSKASFVRRPGSAGSALASPQVFADPEPKNWLQRSIVDISSDRVQEARVSIGKVSYALTRKDRGQTNFSLSAAPRGKALASAGAGNFAGSALAGLELDDVKKFDATEFGTAQDKAEFRSFDGWVVSVVGHRDGERNWIHLDSRYDEALAKTFPVPPPVDPKAAPVAKPDVKKDAEALMARTAAWAYEVPKYKYDVLFKPLDEIAKKP